MMAVVVARAAGRRGRRRWVWFLLSLVINPLFSYIALRLSPDKSGAAEPIIRNVQADEQTAGLNPVLTHDEDSSPRPQFTPHIKTGIIIILSMFVGILFLIVHSQANALRLERVKANELNDKLASLPEIISLDNQEKCARQADEAFKRDGWNKRDGAFFVNHYNGKLGKCFVYIEHTGVIASSVSLLEPIPNPEDIWTTKEVLDAFEGKPYADYMWHMDKIKQYWEVPPFECWAILPSGEKKVCHSPGEFDSMIQEYMGPWNNQ